jgi:hypothetical protein
VSARPKTRLEIRPFDVRKWCAGDTLSVIEQFRFELLGALWVVQRDKVRDLGEIHLCPT